MHVSPRRFLRYAIAAALALSAAHTTRGDDEHALARSPLPDAYREECGACHTPYAARLLPAASWQRIMQGLENHFGTNASLDAETTAELAAWLTAASGGARRAGAAPPEDRITRSGWFIDEHDDFRAVAFGRPAIGSAANCAACHTDADRGDFSERNIRIPR
ncbi:MAG: diheme cytochrome c [Gammaproteobacteria bacterium]|nr:diheme cytochrome c [Gammaproteobacteria bacterium]